MVRFPFPNCRSVLLFSGDVSHAPNSNFLHAAGCDVDGAILVWSGREKALLTSKMNATRAENCFEGRVLSADYADITPTLKRLLPSGKIGLDFRSIRAERYLRLCRLFGKSRLVDVSDPLENLRRVKKEEEISKIAKAVRISKEVLESLSLRPSMTELDVVRQLALGCLERDVSFAFPPIVAAGVNAREPHHEPGSKKLGHGVVLIDFGAKFQHYCADLSRCYFLGPAKEERARYEEAKEMHAAIVDEIPNFRTGGELGRFADEYAKKRLHWPPMLHSIGHGLGIEVHDSPHLGLKSKDKLQPGVVLAIEPGWYGKTYGARFEDDLVIGKKKARVL
jgi:Xaa-Pro aminopeptidase